MRVRKAYLTLEWKFWSAAEKLECKWEVLMCLNADHDVLLIWLQTPARVQSQAQEKMLLDPRES